MSENLARDMARPDAARNQYYDRITNGGQARTINGNVHGNVTFQGDVINNYGGPVPVHPEHPATSDRCLQSLAFPEMTQRREGIAPNTDKTCEWVYKDPQYLEWIRNGGLLWLNGRAGSGKSTIMRSVVQQAEDHSMADMLVVSFFFHRRGVPLQHTGLGLLRSLLHQLLCRDQGLLDDFIRKSNFDKRCRTLGSPGIGWNWSESILREHLKRTLRECSEKQPLVIFIDALDETGEATAKSLMAYFEQVRADVGLRLSICISCRPYPDVMWNYDCVVVVEQGNAGDIAAYLDAEFRRAKGWGARRNADEIKALLSERAAGLFQWVVLVAYRTLQLRNESKELILNAIKKVPHELGDLYDEILGQLSPLDRTLALPLLRWVTFAARPLSLAELRYAVSIDPTMALVSTDDCKLSLHWCSTDEEMSTRLLRVSQGLVSIVGLEKNNEVQFDHESVQDYMLDRGLAYLENQEKSMSHAKWVGREHHILSICCIRLLGAADVLSIEREGDTYWWDAIPPLQYALCKWMYHAELAEASGVCQDDFIQITQWPSFEIWNNWTSLHESRWGTWRECDECPSVEDSPNTLQHVAARYGLNSILTSLIPRVSNNDIRASIGNRRRVHWRPDHIDMRGYEGMTPLSMAARGGHEATVRILLSTHDVDINTKDRYGSTPLMLAVESGRTRTVELLLNAGEVAINETDDYGETALAKATRYWHRAIVKLLLDTNVVDVNIKDKDHNSPLTCAIEAGDEALVRQILNSTDSFDTINFRMKRNGGPAPLMIAAEAGHEAIVQHLINTRNVDVNAPNSWGTTALIAAARRGHEATVGLLIKTGRADVDVQNMDGFTALMVARHGGHESIAQLLIDPATASLQRPMEKQRAYMLELCRPGKRLKSCSSVGTVQQGR